VYRARDTRLDRIVAIKVLREEGSGKPEWRERFEREARTIGSLNHPHICTLYEFGHENGVDHLVMEYLEGETLAARLQKGPLPMEQVLRFGIAIGDALDKAHRRGITHRDLKPGNVIVTKGGPKLLDFGLARQGETARRSLREGGSDVATEAKPLTQEGTVLGTIPYMAPEQLEGKESDARTDLFALGALLYEMATGKRAFEASSQASLIAKIVGSDPPPMSELQPMTPKALERVVKRCLAKDPDERWQSAADLASELKWIAEGGGVATEVSRKRSPQRGLLYPVLTAALSGAVVWFLKPAPVIPLPVTRTVITLPEGERLANLDQPVLALSSDGSLLAYVAIRDGVQQIHVRSMDSFETRALSGTEGGVSPFFSPDGQWLGFVSEGKLKKISVNGGAPVSLSAVTVPRGMSWGLKRSVLFAPIPNGVLQEVPESGGERKSVTRLESGDTGHRWPELLPEGNAMVFAGGTPVNPRLAVYKTGTRASRPISQEGTQPRYLPSGHLVFAQGGNLMAVPFDTTRLEITGPAQPVVDAVYLSPTTGAAQFCTSASGSLAYVSGGAISSERALVWVDHAGKEEKAVPARAYGRPGPRLSPDGRRVAVVIEEQIWLFDFARETFSRFSLGGSSNLAPAWTPDGTRLAYSSNQEGAQNLFWRAVDGSGGAERITGGQNQRYLGSFSPDGRVLAFPEIHPETLYDLWVLRLDDLEEEPFLRTPFTEAAPRFSPDGGWLAYVSDESGQMEVYVQPYPASGGKWQISGNGGVEPVWNPSGRELFYREGDKMMAVDIATDPAFSAGRPTVLFEGPYTPTTGTLPNYDVSADGQRFLMIKESEQAEAIREIHVVLNWSEELKRLVPKN
jgi:serine/threonine-protein kinase